MKVEISTTLWFGKNILYCFVKVIFIPFWKFAFSNMRMLQVLFYWNFCCLGTSGHLAVVLHFNENHACSFGKNVHVLLTCGAFSYICLFSSTSHHTYHNYILIMLILLHNNMIKPFQIHLAYHGKLGKM